MFIDFTEVTLEAGKGGKGSVHFRRENLFQKVAQMEEMVVVVDI